MPEPDDDVFDFEVAGKPRPARKPRSKAARETVPADDAPLPTAAAPDDNEVFAFEVAGKPPKTPDNAASADLSMGPPPGAPSKGLRQPQSRGEMLLEELGKSVKAANQGALLNSGDEIASGIGGLLDYFQMPGGNSVREFGQSLKSAADEYPVGHGAGQAGIGLLAGALVGPGVLAQGATSAALGGASEYMDSHKVLETLGFGALSGAMGAGGAKLGNWAARQWGRVDPMKNALRHGMMTPDEMRGPAQNIVARGGRPTQTYHQIERVDPLADDLVRGAQPMEGMGMRQPAPQGTVPRAPLERIEGMPHGPAAYEPPPVGMDPAIVPPAPPRALPSQVGPTYDPYAGGASAAPVGPPRPLPSEGMPGGYDPLAAGQSAMPAGSPRPLPVPGGAPAAPAPRPQTTGSPPVRGDDLEALLEASIQAPKVVRRGGKFAKPEYTFGELDTSATPALSRAPTEAPYGPEGGASWWMEQAAAEAAGGAPKPRVGGAARELAPEYALGGVDAPAGALPRPRLGGPAVTPEPALPYNAGEYLEHAALEGLDGATPPPPRFGPELPRQEVLRGGARMFDPAPEVPLPPAAPPRVRPGEVGVQRAPMTPVAPLPVADPQWDVATSLQRQAAQPGPSGVIDRSLAVGAHVPGLRMASRAGQLMRTLMGSQKPVAPESGVYLNSAARAGFRGGAELLNEIGAPLGLDQKVNAQDGTDRTAQADAPTLNYALQATLARGGVGLSAEDEQALTAAVVAGDQRAISATDFRLRQLYPAYARRVERELRGLNEGD